MSVKKLNEIAGAYNKQHADMAAARKDKKKSKPIVLKDDPKEEALETPEEEAAETLPKPKKGKK